MNIRLLLLAASLLFSGYNIASDVTDVLMVTKQKFSMDELVPLKMSGLQQHFVSCLQLFP